MNDMLFLNAARNKYRYSTPQGEITTEDLFDLPLTGRHNQANLDQIAIELDQELKREPHTSFVSEKTETNVHKQRQFDIVLAVIELKKQAAERAQKAADTRAKKQRIMELIATKEDDELRGQSKEELEALLQSME